MKKNLSRVLVLVMVLAMLLPMGVAASTAPDLKASATYRSLKIDGEEIHSGWWTDTTTPKDVKIPAGVQYVAATNTLYLSNANINNVVYSAIYRNTGVQVWNPATGKNEAALLGSDVPLNIVLAGENRINPGVISSKIDGVVYSMGNVFNASGDVVISGNGKLILSDTHSYQETDYTIMNVGGKLTVQSGEVIATSYDRTAIAAYDGIAVNVAGGAKLTASVEGPFKGNHYLKASAIIVGSTNRVQTSGKPVITTGPKASNAEAVEKLLWENSSNGYTYPAWVVENDPTDSDYPGYYTDMNIRGRILASSESYVNIQAAQKIKAKRAKKTIKVGATFEVAAVSRVKGVPVGVCTFTSNKKKVATVDKETGLVTGVSKGKAKITIKQSNGAKAYCTITVK